MIRPGLLLRAVRAPSLAAGAMPVLLLAALVVHEGRPLPLGVFLLTLLGLLSLQAGVNVVNDLFDDASGLDADPEFARNPFPLGSRVIQTGALGRRGMWMLAGGCFGTGAACGLFLNTLHPGNVVLWIGASAALLGFVYTAPPLRIAYHGAGEPVIFLLFGPMAGLGTSYVLTGGADDAAALLSCVAGALAVAILFLHHFPQHAADARHGKRTPVVRLGPAGAGRLVPLLVALPFALVAAGAAMGWLPPAALVFFAAAPLAWRASRSALRHAGDPRRMTAAFGQVMGMHLLGGLLLAGSLLIS